MLISCGERFRAAGFIGVSQETVKFVLTNSCDNTFTYTLNVLVGTPVPTSITTTVTSGNPYTDDYVVYTPAVAGVTSYNWSFRNTFNEEFNNVSNSYALHLD